MGWKSTKTITRKKAIELIISRALDATEEELSNGLCGLGYGDNPELPYYGCNFSIDDNDDDNDDEINF